MESQIRKALRAQVSEHLFAVSQALGANSGDVISSMMQVSAAVIACSTKPECREQVLAAVADEFRLIVAEAFANRDQLAAANGGLAQLPPAGRA